MRSGRSVASATLREAVNRRPLLSNPIWGACALVRTPRPEEDFRLPQPRPPIICRPYAPFARIFGWRYRPLSVRERKSAMVLSALLLAVASYTEACAQTATAAFRAVDYEDPQPTQPIFAHTWPGLIDTNNKALSSGFLHMKAAPGHNLSLVLNNAEIPIPGGIIVASIRSGLEGGCHIGSISQDETPRAFSCPARVTVYKDGQARTKDIGFICRVGSTSPADVTHMSYDPKANTLTFSAVIGGKAVPFSNTDEPCDRTIALAE